MLLHLKREGYTVEWVENSEAALNLVLKNEYQLLVVDWMLPGISGLELAKKMRSERKISEKVPILMVTARAQAADIVVGLEVGADDYLTKPFELPVFLARVRALLRRSQISSEELDGRMQVGSRWIWLC
jgi:two-component system phosphate regulon response regulator PhoB